MTDIELKYNNALVDRFNRLYRIGDTVEYAEAKVTTKTNAFLNQGSAVVVFNEIDHFRSISPKFINYPIVINYEKNHKRKLRSNSQNNRASNCRR